MKTPLVTVSLAALCASGSVWAQSSVTLYGIIDEGLTFSNNQLGKQSWQMQSGISQGSRWGLLGTEDLGGGLSAVFRLENGFDINSGKLLQQGREFGRAAYVGLASNRFGTLTLGRQNELMGDYVGQYTANGNWGILFPHPGDLDNTGIDFRVNNAVRYASPVFYGVQAGAVYGFGNVAGQMNRDAVKSFGVKYAGGPLALAAAFTTIDHPAEAVPEGVWTSTNVIDGNYGIAAAKYQSFGFAGQYTFGAAKVAAIYTNTRFMGLDPTLGAKIGGHVTFQIFEVVGSYFITPALQLGTGYSYTEGEVSANSQKPKYHNFDAIADYFLSKRTDAYLQATFMHAAGDAKVADLAPVLQASSTVNQVEVRLGLRHRF
ncbi:porin [Paraburkholderia silvatlantica]|uniref:Porin n=1 Tax=Paraburkholderia silvatlantica TaxID=321895 RepID=A0A2U1A9T0_9BURK|nr:porin [Paraburkholderia silvatlantica]MBB2930629.1 putative porin [Paraburkholderia silvatlantica]PVY30430.1 putative porin [Paraburkholderia silvatlantica]PXW36833.1 putative porin [Paraburkholderia silvatlantica]PYE21174.1 putative porin [Paraburkholderia silvatlantica]TDQ86685.1 putative porin [Paraburkholderia silvatlantica]